MNRQEVIQAAWAEAEYRVPFRLLVSVPHGAVLPDGWDGMVVLEVGPSLQHPCKLTMNEDELLTTLTFGDGVSRGRPFDVVIPWGALHCVEATGWVVTWRLGKVVSAERLRSSPGHRVSGASHLQVVK